MTVFSRVESIIWPRQDVEPIERRQCPAREPNQQGYEKLEYCDAVVSNESALNETSGDYQLKARPRDMYTAREDTVISDFASELNTDFLADFAWTESLGLA